jgi:ATP-binding cassette, subfamily A (ABC1), member 3
LFSQGVKKPLWYFLSPSYWGLTTARVMDKIEVIEESTDDDVLAEEALAQVRQNQPMAPTSAIEIRGLRATFTRGGKAFHAVKCPWYSVEKRQLFALLGPNGAGKTTTINMLTGFLPPTDGNA